MRLTTVCTLAALLAASTAWGQISYPMLMSLKPVAAQVGQTSEHEVAARYNLAGAYAVLVSGEGVTAEVVEPAKPKDDKASGQAKRPAADKLKLRIAVAPDAQPGVRDFRIATPQGVSTLGQLVITRDPVISEKAKNNSLKEAEAITLPATVCGAIESAEDIDFYKFNVAAGATLSFHVRSTRLQDKIHDLQTHSDPIIAIRNASGTIVAQVDNYFFGDPLLSHRFDMAGEYFLEIRDVRYQGNQYWQYSIEISDRPFVTNIFPLAIEPAHPTAVRLVGYEVPAEPMTVSLPAEADGPMWVSVPMGDAPANPVPVVASALPIVIESAEENNTLEKAQGVTVPATVNGRIESEADVDCFAFEAKKGERFTFEVIARRQQSLLDSNLRLLDAKGKSLVENDDLSTGRHVFGDSLVEFWAAPADGKYVVEIRDLHLRGGDSYVYAVNITRSEPYFTLEADTDKTVLAPGTSGVVFVRAYRKNGFAGDIQLAIDDLPDGVTASCGRILADGKDGCIVLAAAADAKMAAANVTISGQGTHAANGGSPVELTAVARPLQETYMPGGGRGHYPVEMHTVSVAEALDIKSVKVSPTEFTLKPGGSQKVEITIERAEGFDKNVTLDCLYRHLAGVYGDTLPKGVTVDAKNSKTLLTGKQVQGHITLVAAKDAKPAEKQQTVMMANIAINFVMKMTYASEPVFITIEE
jgi:hypothetical protein